jgi:hypothetical protein
MKRFIILFFWLLAVVPVWAATKAVVVTGPVTEVREDVVVIQKGKQQWEIARSPATKIKGELRKGALVTVEVYLSAGAIEVREEKKQ